MDSSYDVVIAGGGPVGALLALALGESPLSLLHVDSAEAGTGTRAGIGTGAGAERPIALSHGSRLLLDRYGVFRRIHNTPILTIHVSQRGGFGRTLMRADDYALPALGYVAAYSAIRAAMAGESKSAPLIGRVTAWSDAPAGLSVSLQLPDAGHREVQTRLLVLADGGASEMRASSPPKGAASAGVSRIRDYAQSALVAQVQAEKPHRNTAYERFTPQGPLALLPNDEGYAMVWCTRAEEALELREMGDRAFLDRLGARFGARLGKFVACSKRQSFPLALRYLTAGTAPRVIAIGNAAQTLHPVGGQGMNLGLRDAWELAASILKRLSVLDQPDFSAGFMAQRSADRRAEISLTDSLVRVFSHPDRLVGAARGAALMAIDTLPRARRLLAAAMMYGLRSGR